MFDTMTMTKLGGGLFAALLVLLLGNWAASGLYAVGAGEHGGSEAAYVIETGADTTAAAPVEVSFADVYANADPSKGERVFRQCQGCHNREEGANGVGPYLYGVVGRDIGSAAGFSYTDALTSLEGNWTPEKLNHFLTNPGDYASGTAMTFRGLRDIEDRANIIAYLDSLDN